MRKRNPFRIAGAILALSLCMVAAADRPREQKYQQAVDLLESKGDVKQAIRLFEDVANSSDRNLAARALFYLGSCYEKLGNEGAQKAYERIVREFGDQAVVTAKARTRLAAIGGKQPETGVVTTRLWSGGGARRYRSVSPDGRFAVFTVELVTVMRSHKGGTVNLHDLLSGETRKIADVDPVSRFTHAVISPDGTQIAYTTETASARRVHLVRADGSNARILSGTDAEFCDVADWSADGKQLLGSVSLRGGVTKAVWFSVADGSYKVLGMGGVDRLSPDGRYALKYNRGLVVVTLDGWRETQLVTGRAGNPVWTPDGTRVLFQSDRRGTNDLWSIRVVNGKPEGPPEVVRENLGGGPSSLGFTRNGDYYYNSGLSSSNLYVAEVDPQSGKLVSQPKQITDRYTSFGPAWSPDGESLAYSSKRSAEDWNKGAPVSVIVRSLKTGAERVWLDGGWNLNWAKPQWFPDSQSLFLHPGAGKLLQLDLKTGTTQALLKSESIRPYGQQNGYRPGVVMAPDGHSVYYILHETKGNAPSSEMKLEAARIRVIRRDLPDGQERELCQLEAVTGFGPFISTDSSRLAFWVNFPDRRSALMTIPANGGAPSEVRTGHNFVADDLDSKPGQLLARPDSAAWSPSGRLFFVTQPPRGGQGGDEIWSVSPEGGEAQPLGLALHKVWSLDVSPDGKRLVFFDDSGKMEMSVVKNLFPATKPSH